jgi:hypothetical protein
LILPTDRRESSTRSGVVGLLGCHCGSITYASGYRFRNRSEHPGNSRAARPPIPTAGQYPNASSHPPAASGRPPPVKAKTRFGQHSARAGGFAASHGCQVTCLTRARPR